MMIYCLEMLFDVFIKLLLSAKHAEPSIVIVFFFHTIYLHNNRFSYVQNDSLLKAI